MTFTPTTPVEAAASVSDTIRSINTAARSKGGHYKDYSCKVVSWDDVQRGTVGGSLSCWGSNITDTRLYAKDGRSLFTVRSDNWNERLGRTTTSDIAVIADSVTGAGLNPRPFTLKDILSSPSKFGNYCNLNSEDLTKDMLDKTVSIRFQTTFLPSDAAPDGRSTLQFAPEAYNYNTTSDSNPRNLIFLCTSQGLAIQQDGAGAKKLFHQSVASPGSEIRKRYWLEAESSDHKVGGRQKETDAERADAIARGKATSSVIGVEGMGTRFNALMTIQVPLQQKQQKRRTPAPAASASLYDDDCFAVTCKCVDSAYDGAYDSSSDDCFDVFEEEGCEFECEDFDGDDCEDCDIDEIQPASCASEIDNLDDVFLCQKKSVNRESHSIPSKPPKPPKVGKSSAARVSRGDEVIEGEENGTWSGLTVEEPERNHEECITCTVVMYYICQGGVPSEDDVVAAIDDLESLYKSCEDNGRLGDENFDFMKKELTVKDIINIKEKVTTQPPPKPNGVSLFNVFPNGTK